MPQVVADFLEGEVAGHEMCRASMPERVRTSMRAGIPHLGQARARQMIEGAGGEGTDRRAERQEDLRPCPTWPDLLQIPEHGQPQGLAERIDLGTALLGTHNRDLLMCPIELIEAERGHFTTPEPVHS